MTAHLETIMPILSDLRRALDQALTHTSNAAILRLPESERTVEGLARAYLPRTIYLLAVDGQSYRGATLPGLLQRWEIIAPPPLDLTDPGTAHALLVALALALGLDPGVGGIGVMWERFDAADPCWILHTHGMRIFCASDAPSIATEPDPIKALALALLHVCPRETP